MNGMKDKGVNYRIWLGFGRTDTKADVTKIKVKNKAEASVDSDYGISNY